MVHNLPYCSHIIMTGRKGVWEGETKLEGGEVGVVGGLGSPVFREISGKS